MLLALLPFLLTACSPTVDESDEGDQPWQKTRPPNPTCVAPARPLSTRSVEFVASFGGREFTRPVGMVPSPEGGDIWTVIQQRGEVLRVSEDGTVGTAMFTVPEVYMGSSELGLLGIAWHPHAAENRLAFLNYTTVDGGQIRSHIARVEASADFQTFDGTTLESILTLDQPYENHNGGHLAFGPDGYLYVGFGDGGSGGDPHGNGQDLDVLLGKMLRIDVDGPAPYGIPADNPFAAGGGAPEVYAWGLRNPWRYFFDPESGALWAGDVGQNEWEEFDLIERGGDYGWNDMEGSHCYKPAQGCETAGKVLPVAEYAHDGDDSASITGGPVYRGAAIPELEGVPLFADVYSGTVYGLFPDPVSGAFLTEEVIPNSGTLPVSFGQSPEGEVFVIDYGGLIHALVPTTDNDPGEASSFPSLLSETGCFEPNRPSEPVDALFPYDVNSPLWSDGAEKRRWFALPDGTTPSALPDGDLDLPVGSVVVKEFRLKDTPVETRLLVRHEDGNWAGYSYRWRADGSDADLLAADAAATWGEDDWRYPSRGQCLACHTTAAGRTLGLTTPQLDRTFDYPWGETANQLDQLALVGLLTVEPDAVEALPSPGHTGTVDEQARAYLDVNCANCHLPGGTGLGAIDLRFATPFAETALCGAEPIHGDLGVAGATLLSPGKPDRSVLSLRMHTTDANRMPGMGSDVVDTEGTALIDQWIAAIAACP